MTGNAGPHDRYAIKDVSVDAGFWFHRITAWETYSDMDGRDQDEEEEVRPWQVEDVHPWRDDECIRWVQCPYPLPSDTFVVLIRCNNGQLSDYQVTSFMCQWCLIRKSSLLNDFSKVSATLYGVLADIFSSLTLEANHSVKEMCDEVFDSAWCLASLPKNSDRNVLSLLFEIRAYDTVFRTAREIAWDLAEEEYAAAQTVVDDVEEDPTRDYEEVYRSNTEIIESLPRGKYEKGACGENETEDCLICLAKYSNGEEITLIPCSHFFHSKCILWWFDRAMTCPLCPFNINP